ARRDGCIRDSVRRARHPGRRRFSVRRPRIREGTRRRRARPRLLSAIAPPMIDEPFVRLLRDSRRLLIVTGAGISTASGVPDFRGPNGVWTRRRPVYYDDFMASPEARAEYWDFKLESWEIYQRAEPNAVHRAIVDLERAGRIEAVVTQNVDGLHAR